MNINFAFNSDRPDMKLFSLFHLYGYAICVEFTKYTLYVICIDN